MQNGFRSASSHRQSIQSLERRRLLATLIGTELRIEGTAGNDRIRVETIGANVVVTQNAVAQSFNKTKVKTINANLRNGNDRIDIVWNVVATTTISGEGGNDTVLGGDYKDAIYTGSGNDVVYGNRGGDFIQTSVGDDFVAPGFGNDTVDTGDGNDQLSYADRSSAITAEMNAMLTYRFDASLLPASPFVDLWETSARVTSGSETDSAKGIETVTSGSGADELSLIVTDQQDYPSNGPLRAQVFRINGGAGNDTMNPSSVDDTYPGELAQLIVDGGDGNDNIGGYAVYTAIGGNGDDSFFADQSDDSTAPRIDAGPGIDTFEFGRLSPMYTMPAGLENLIIRTQTTGPLTVVGNDLPNVINAYLDYGSYASIDGRGGDDLITLVAARVFYTSTILGGAGNDTITGSISLDSILGGDGNDSIDGGLGVDSIYGGAGDDRITASVSDAVSADAGDDTIGISEYLLSLTSLNFTYGTGKDSLRVNLNSADFTMPTDLEDLIASGGDGAIRVFGNESANRIHVNGNGSVVVDAKGGNDSVSFEGDDGLFQISGGEGDDTIQGSTSMTAFRPTKLNGGNGDDSITGSVRAPNLIDAGSGNDTLLGGEYNDTLLGGNDRDSIVGGFGDDSIDGGLGADSIYGGSGTDRAKRDTADAIVDSIEVFF